MSRDEKAAVLVGTRASGAPPRPSRRAVLRGAVGAAAVLAAPGALLAGAVTQARALPAAPVTAGAARFTPDVAIALRAMPTRAQLLPGPASEIWTLRGQVMSGSASALVEHPSQALGPTLHVRRGQKLRIVFDNALAEPTVLHWHGLSVPEAMDGHPRYAIAPGQRYVYEFEVRNRAGTYWYHAHPDGRTGPQVYRGMAGLFIVHDQEEDALLLPRGEFDLPLALQDRSFGPDNELLYSAAPMVAMAGWLGDRVLVNGTADLALPVRACAYRLRLLNASNSRIYRLAWADGTPLTVIGTDGGLLPQPVTKASVLLAPAERLELWADFSGRTLSSELVLTSLAFGAASGPGPMRSVPPQGAPLRVMSFRVDAPGRERLTVPAKLTPIARYARTDAVQLATPRRIVPTMARMSWGLNFRTFGLTEVADDERVKLGTLELWEFDNTGMAGGAGGGRGGRGMRGMGMMGMALPHPMHLHSGQFQILDRDGVTHDDYVDGGWKDTVLVLPGERVRILMRFDDYPGLFLYHCHNLEHEDRGMMRNFSIEG